MVKYNKIENQEITEPAIVAEREPGLSPKKRKLLEETMRRHDKVFKILANM